MKIQPAYNATTGKTGVLLETRVGGEVLDQYAVADLARDFWRAQQEAEAWTEQYRTTGQRPEGLLVVTGGEGQYG